MTLKLRPYQETALYHTFEYFKEKSGDPVIVLPTGSGKSLVIAEWVRFVFDMDPNARILIITHVRELVSQNYAELMALWPDAPAGIYSAGLNRRELGARILFASIQSIHKRALQIQQCDMVLIDEAHLIPRKSNTMYRRFLAELRRINPHLKIIGLTATPFRLDSGMLHEGDDALFTDIAHETPVRELIDDEYLSPPVSHRQKAEIDVTGVGTRGGEFIAAQLEVAALDPPVINAIADRIVEVGADRHGWLVFGCTVAHCEALNEALRARGVSSAAVFGETDKRERDRLISDFKARKIRALCSMGVLTTGFNARHVDLVALARPTKSTGLYIQMVGRGTRLSPETGKTNCLVLDFGGNIARHGPFDDPYIPKKKKGTGPAPFKECPECGCACGTMTRLCPECGFEFPPPERLIHQTPDNKPILAEPPPWLEVSSVACELHEKPDKPPSMKVTYRVGLGVMHREWVCFSHTGYARSKAEVWWQRRGNSPVPRNTHEALARAAAGELQHSSAIQVKPNGPYTEIVRHRFDQDQQEKAA
jgi:DNA repair protein RadD